MHIGLVGELSPEMKRTACFFFLELGFFHLPAWFVIRMLGGGNNRRNVQVGKLCEKTNEPTMVKRPLQLGVELGDG